MTKSGYVIIRGGLNESMLKKIDAYINIKSKKNHYKLGTSEPGVPVSMLTNLHEELPWSKLNINLILDKASALLNNKMKVWNIKANLKQRWHGSCEYFHQDSEYWKSWGINSNDGCTAIVFIDNHSHANGGLWVIPGSHLQDYEHIPFLNINNLQKKLIPTDVLDKLVKKNKPKEIIGKRGDIVIFHSKLVHGSGHNISNVNRRTVLIQMCSEHILNSKNQGQIQKAFHKKRIWETRQLSKELKIRSKIPA